MKEPSQSLLQRLSEIITHSPDVRFGQLLANLGFLAEARGGHSLWDIEDEQLMEVMDQHLAELAAREEPSLTRRTT